MSNAHFRIPLLRDAAARTIASPGASHCWHRLADSYRRVDDVFVKGAVVQDLLAHTPEDGVAGFLRATWLASMMNDDAHLAAAGRIVQNIAPFDPDRLVAYLIFASRVLKHASDRAAFVQAVRFASFPDILHKLGQHLSRQVEARPPDRAVGRVRKLALITPYLNAYPHAPTAAALLQAGILIGRGVQVAVFSCTDVKVPGMEHFLGGAECSSLDPFDARQWKSHLPPGLVIRQGVDRFSVMGRWTQMLKEISVFDPDLVMSVGFYSPLVAPLHEARPVLGLNVHSVQPLDPVDVWLSAFREDAGETTAGWGGHLPERVAWYHPYRVPPTLPGVPGSAIPRHELGLPETALVLVSVGYRLETEIAGAWASRMIALLRDQPGVTWLLVGGTGAMPAALAHAPAAQVRVLRARGDIPAVLRCCDIYVNPPRMGGGFSVAEAMAEGLPVVAYGGSDGGHKVGSAAARDDADYFSRLTALIASADLRRQEGQAMRALFSSTLDLDQSATSLLAACDLALERFRQRTTRVTS